MELEKTLKPELRDLKGRPYKVDINKTLKEKKKAEILEIYSQETGLSIDMLNNIWNFCEKADEKVIKQIKNNKYKNKNLPKRREYKDGEILETATVRPLTEEELKKIYEPPKIEETLKIEEIKD